MYQLFFISHPALDTVTVVLCSSPTVLRLAFWGCALLCFLVLHAPPCRRHRHNIRVGVNWSQEAPYHHTSTSNKRCIRYFVYRHVHLRLQLPVHHQQLSELPQKHEHSPLIDGNLPAHLTARLVPCLPDSLHAKFQMRHFEQKLTGCVYAHDGVVRTAVCQSEICERFCFQGQRTKDPLRNQAFRKQHACDRDTIPRSTHESFKVKRVRLALVISVVGLPPLAQAQQWTLSGPCAVEILFAAGTNSGIASGAHTLYEPCSLLIFVSDITADNSTASIMPL